jgi:nuclear pore complex protein Nup133
LYTALTEVLRKENRTEGYHLYFDKTLPTPSVAEVSSRWPGMSPDEVEALRADYQRESDHVRDLGLEDVYDRVRELASLREDVFQ